MDSFNYNKKKLESIINKPSSESIEMYSKMYAFTSANLLHFYPSLSNRKHFNFFKRCLFNQQISALEQSNTSLIDALEIRNESLYNIQLIDKPLIFGTFHLGSYRILLSYLIKLGYKISLIVDDYVYKGQKDVFMETWNFLEKYYKNGSILNIINVEKESSIFKMIRSIKSGNILVTYLDGNSGTGKQLDENKNLLKINFFNQEIYVRKGVATISHFLKLNIIPVLSYRLQDKIHLHFFKECLYNNNIKKEEYSKKITSLLYENFEHYLTMFPCQWEGWFYMNKWMKLCTTNNDGKQKIDEQEIIKSGNYMPFKYCINKYFILDKTNYTSYQISGELYKKLSLILYR